MLLPARIQSHFVQHLQKNYSQVACLCLFPLTICDSVTGIVVTLCVHVCLILETPIALGPTTGAILSTFLAQVITMGAHSPQAPVQLHVPCPWCSVGYTPYSLGFNNRLVPRFQTVFNEYSLSPFVAVRVCRRSTPPCHFVELRWVQTRKGFRISPSTAW